MFLDFSEQYLLENYEKSISGWSKIETSGPEQNLKKFKNYSSKWAVIGSELSTKVGLQHILTKIKSEILGVYPWVILGGMPHMLVN